MTTRVFDEFGETYPNDRGPGAGWNKARTILALVAAALSICVAVFEAGRSYEASRQADKVTQLRDDFDKQVLRDQQMFASREIVEVELGQVNKQLQRIETLLDSQARIR